MRQCEVARNFSFHFLLHVLKIGLVGYVLMKSELLLKADFVVFLKCMFSRLYDQEGEMES